MGRRYNVLLRKGGQQLTSIARSSGAIPSSRIVKFPLLNVFRLFAVVPMHEYLKIYSEIMQQQEKKKKNIAIIDTTTMHACKEETLLSCNMS